MSAANSVKRGEFEDYIECEDGNNPITGLGFYVSDAKGAPFEENAYSQWITCEECGAVYDIEKIAAAAEGDFIEADFHECSECGVDLADEWHDKSCSVYADWAQDVAAGER